MRKESVLEDEDLAWIQLLFKHWFSVRLSGGANIAREIEVALRAFPDPVEDVKYAKFLSVMMGECYYVCISPEKIDAERTVALPPSWWQEAKKGTNEFLRRGVPEEPETRVITLTGNASTICYSDRLVLP